MKDCYATLAALNDITLIRIFQATNQSAGETGITIWCISQSGGGLAGLAGTWLDKSSWTSS